MKMRKNSSEKKKLRNYREIFPKNIFIKCQKNFRIIFLNEKSQAEQQYLKGDSQNFVFIHKKKCFAFECRMNQRNIQQH